MWCSRSTAAARRIPIPTVRDENDFFQFQLTSVRLFQGIRFRKDYLRSGITSDYGRNSNINRVPTEDMVLYQTERYDLQKFSYEIDLIDDGDYVLWMKFAEVWFNGPNMKVNATSCSNREESWSLI